MLHLRLHLLQARTLTLEEEAVLQRPNEVVLCLQAFPEIDSLLLCGRKALDLGAHLNTSAAVSEIFSSLPNTHLKHVHSTTSAHSEF